MLSLSLAASHFFPFSLSSRYVAAGAAAATAAAGGVDGSAASSAGTPAWLLALGAAATLGAVKLVGDAAGEALKGGQEDK